VNENLEEDTEKKATLFTPTNPLSDNPDSSTSQSKLPLRVNTSLSQLQAREPFPTTTAQVSSPTTTKPWVPPRKYSSPGWSIKAVHENAGSPPKPTKNYVSYSSSNTTSSVNSSLQSSNSEPIIHTRPKSVSVSTFSVNRLSGLFNPPQIVVPSTGLNGNPSINSPQPDSPGAGKASLNAQVTVSNLTFSHIKNKVQIPSTENVDEPLCLGCEKPVRGHVILADGFPHHERCFRCFSCCKVISDNFTSAGEYFFHPECAKCVHCNCALVGKTFHIQSGKVYCEKDFKKICHGCGRVIALGRSELIGKNIYHARCVRCSVCNESFFGEMERHVIGDKIYCTKDFVKLKKLLAIQTS